MQQRSKAEEAKQYKRGLFKIEESWTKDKTQCYYSDKWMTVYWPLIKATLVVTLFILLQYVIGLGKLLSFAIILVTIVFSQNLVAHYYGLIPIPAMDQGTFLGQNKQVSNYANSSGFNNAGDREMLKARFSMMIKLLPKMRNHLVVVAGDYYYKSLSIEETLEKGIIQLPDGMIRTQRDIECFIQDNLNRKLPLDGPLWRYYFTNIVQDDGTLGMVQVYLCHHSLADGISTASVALALSEEYARDYFIKLPEPTFLQVLFVKLLAPFYLPQMMIQNLSQRPDQNFITRDKQRRMTGELNCKVTKELSFPEIRMMSKKLGITINDVVTCAISAAIKQLFKEHGDPSKEIQIAIPGNIRFKFYQSRENVKLENKFTLISIKMPLCDTMESAQSKITKMTKQLKKMFVMTYAQYLVTYIGQLIMLKWINSTVVDMVTSNYTLAFSNTPGAIKPLYFLNKAGEKVSLIWSYTSMITPGFIGVQVNAQTCCDSFRVCVTSDNGLLSEKTNARIAELIEEQIQMEKERTKDMALPEDKKEK